MKIVITGKNIRITESLKNAVELKLSRLEKYFNQSPEVKVTLGTQKLLQKIEVTIPLNNTILRAEEMQEDLYSAIDMVVDKLGRQIRKHKTKLQKRDYDTIRFENVEDLEVYSVENQKPSIVKRKKVGLKPMMEEEAILQMELLGHDFFVFINAETDETNVLYKRKDGQYGIIEPDFEEE